MTFTLILHVLPTEDVTKQGTGNKERRTSTGKEKKKNRNKRRMSNEVTDDRVQVSFFSFYLSQRSFPFSVPRFSHIRLSNNFTKPDDSATIIYDLIFRGVCLSL